MGELMGLSPAAVERDTSKRTIMIAIAAIVAGAGVVALVMRESPRENAGPPPYAAKLKLGDLKMSQAQNFVGGTVTYIDGTIANAGDKTVTHATVQVTFKDLYDQVAQVETVPVKLLQSGGPYLDTADLSVAPLAPSQSKAFRLIFEHVSGQWNQALPELRITDVTTK